MAAVILPAGLLSAVAPDRGQAAAARPAPDRNDRRQAVRDRHPRRHRGHLRHRLRPGRRVRHQHDPHRHRRHRRDRRRAGARLRAAAHRPPGRPEGGALPGAAAALLPVALLLVVVAPNPCQKETEYHCARVVADPDRPGGRTLELDTLRHSYVDLSDPEYLEFDYTKAIASVADAIRPPGAPMQALHIGGGGFTIAALPGGDPAGHPQHGAGDRRRRGRARPRGARRRRRSPGSRSASATPAPACGSSRGTGSTSSSATRSVGWPCPGT